MSCSLCGCASLPCGCCTGVQAVTPQTIDNRPGLPALSWRVGTHGTFLETMQARLSTMAVDGPGLDGQPLSGLRPLQALTTRDPSDPAIALLDAWATVGDVLTFYQERIANECYLRTATERRSVLGLSQLLGYVPRPGVSASTYLAYTLDDQQLTPTTIPTGSRTQSVPAPGQNSQAFETSDDLVARRDWNNLQVRLQQPQDIRLANVLTLASLQVTGTSTNLKAGDKLLFAFTVDGSVSAVREVASVNTQFADQTSAIALRPLDPVLMACTALLAEFLVLAATMLSTDSTGTVQRVIARGDAFFGDVLLGSQVDPTEWAAELLRSEENPQAVPALASAIATFGQALAAIEPTRSGVALTTTSGFTRSLLVPAVAQARNSLALDRSLAVAFVPSGAQVANAAGNTLANRSLAHLTSGVPGPAAPTSASAALSPETVGTESAAPVYGDSATQLLIRFAPTLAHTYYPAWSGASLSPAAPALQGVFALRARASLFGATAPKLPTYAAAGATLPVGTLLPPNQWGDWTYGDALASGVTDETSDNAFLDQANENVVAGSYVISELQGVRQVRQVTAATTRPRTAYALSGQATELALAQVNGRSWRSIDANATIADLRQTKLYVQSDALTLVQQTITEPVNLPDASDPAALARITLDGLYDGLQSGRWVIFQGERDDIDAVSGVTVAELQMISGVSHSYDSTLAGDTVHTTLTLATNLSYRYKRATLTIFGNVVAGTNGQTRSETLGSGDGSQEFQAFTLKQPPLTFVAAPTAAGAASTLEVQVNGVDWTETGSLAFLGPKDQGFVTQIADDGTPSVTFGDGVHGARLPSGVQNVQAIYRTGIGQGGNLDAGQLTLLQTRPLGVRAVTNPLAATGGADPEPRDLARENAPLSVQALDRLVSVADYADFTRGFAGIAKAVAQRVSDGRRQLVYLTIAGVDDMPIVTTSDLYANLVAALEDAGDPDLPLQVDLRTLKALVLSANLKMLAGYTWETVVATVRAALLAQFGFDQRALGQPALLSEVIAAMQGVAGVDYVDIAAFGAIAQTDASGDLLSQDDIVAAVAAIVQPTAYLQRRVRDRLPSSVPSWPGGSSAGVLRPAELAVFVPDVPDTLVLNQIP